MFVRRFTIFCLLLLAAVTACAQAPQSRLSLTLQQRLDTPLRVVAASVTLVDFVGFMATSYKVPMLVETISPVPDLKIPAGTYTARQMLDVEIQQLHGYEWRNEGGVAHVYQTGLEKAPRNLLNARIPRFAFPKTVGEFMYLFRPCVWSVVQGYGCEGGALSGFVAPKLKQPQLPAGEEFKDASARAILLRALQENGQFYVLVAFESTHPKLKSEFPFRNWFAESLEEDQPSPMGVQRPHW